MNEVVLPPVSAGERQWQARQLRADIAASAAERRRGRLLFTLVGGVVAGLIALQLFTIVGPLLGPTPPVLTSRLVVGVSLTTALIALAVARMAQATRRELDAARTFALERRLDEFAKSSRPG